MSQQQQQMNMAGGPVGGGPPSQQPQVGTPSSGDGSGLNAIKRLNTAIYDYLLRNSLYDVARGFVKQMEIEEGVKKSPTQRGQPNGVSDDGMDVDQVAEIRNRPEDLPLPLQLGDGPFLQDWWCQFWEIYTGYRGKGGRNQVLGYIGQQRSAQKARTNMMAAGGMDAANMQRMQMNGGMMMQGMNNGVMGMQSDLQRKAMQNRQNNLTPAQQQQQQQALIQMQRQQQMQGNAMERQNSQMDMSGPRSGSPASGEAPSPKRQRLEGNMQQMNQQRPGPPNQMPSNQVGLPTSSHPGTPNMSMSLPEGAYAHTEQLLRQKGLEPSHLTPQQFNQLALQPANHQQKSVDAYSASLAQTMKTAMHKNQGMTPNPNASMGGGQGSPMSMDVSGEFYATNAANGGRGSMPPGMPGQPPNAAAAGGQAGNNGNHALQDYQMQLMLLEQQNKKRLLMARQEQDSMANPGMPPGPGGFQQGMSPGAQGRGGDPSPNAGDMQRGTPKMNKGMSPNGDMGGRGSPQPGMMNPGMGPDQLRQQMHLNGQMMRPPSSHPIGPGGAPLTQEQMLMMRSQGGMMPNGNWQPGQGPPMMPGQGPPGPNMMGRQQPMGPPPAPPAGTTGPSSPAQAPAPPTPSQTTKAKAGTKKGDGKKGKKGAQNTSATPASESEAPPTPTPQTPITPMHQNSFNHNQNKGMPNGQGPLPQQGQPPQNQNNQQQAVQPPQQTMMDQPFGSLDDNTFGGMSMDFGADLGGDVLDNFDFDSFLNTGDGDPGLGFDANFAFGDGLEAGTDLQGGN
ncbi:hypothetical protein LTR56_004555 [Elasticomyces elasticus]|nr:hypothetical protein LTR56_004555 [Elasticomyces elasticus]KAK3659925.1 hypothetical protein LTR22_008292 [Elasticomyces elasticus]KAK5768131.1 hypothetical protein LTS12_001615 [Elasticomyces elasticus]